jgi:hypothetical protein
VGPPKGPTLQPSTTFDADKTPAIFFLKEPSYDDDVTTTAKSLDIVETLPHKHNVVIHFFPLLLFWLA